MGKCFLSYNGKVNFVRRLLIGNMGHRHGAGKGRSERIEKQIFHSFVHPPYSIQVVLLNALISPVTL